MDIAVNLVEEYLRLNGYLTMTEVGVQRLGRDGHYESITDVDVVAIRYPGDLYAVDAHLDPSSQLLLIEDPDRDDFANQVLSAMRLQFGGHEEKDEPE